MTIGNNVKPNSDPMIGSRIEGNDRLRLIEQLQLPVCMTDELPPEPQEESKDALRLLLKSPAEIGLMDRMLLFMKSDLGIPVENISNNLRVSGLLAFMLNMLKGDTFVIDTVTHGNNIKATYGGVPSGFSLVDLSGRTVVHYTDPSGLYGITKSLSFLTGWTPLMETLSSVPCSRMSAKFQDITGLFFTDVSVGGEGVGVPPERSSSVWIRFMNGVIGLFYNSPHHGPIYLLPGPRERSTVSPPFAISSPDVFEIVGIQADGKGLQAVERANPLLAETLLQRGAFGLLGGSVLMESAVQQSAVTGLAGGGAVFGVNGAARAEAAVRRVAETAKKIEDAGRNVELKTGRFK